MDSNSVEESSHHSLFSEEESTVVAAWDDSIRSGTSVSIVVSASLSTDQRPNSIISSPRPQSASNDLNLHISSSSLLDKECSVSLSDKSMTSLLDKSLTFNEYYGEEGYDLTASNHVPLLLNASSGSSSLLDKSLTFSDYYGEKEQPDGTQVLEPMMPPLAIEEEEEEDNDLMINCVRGHLQAPKNSVALQEPGAPQSSFSIPKKEGFRAHFANNKSMSVGRMEMTIDTVIKAHEKRYDKKATRRLSFGYVLNQSFDKTTPACAIAQGWVDRMEEWDPTPSKGDKVKESKPTRLKSILKTMKKRLSFGRGGGAGAGGNSDRRRGSFLGTKEVQSTAPKMPGRRGSFHRGLWAVPVRRGSFWGKAQDEISQTDEDRSAESTSKEPESKSTSKRRGSFFGRACRRLSNGGRFSTGDGQIQGPASPPQKPRRRCSQDGVQVQRRGSFLGMGGRRFSNGGSKNITSLSPPPRRQSSTVVASLA